jgi:tRNA G18 (ribose-2'-O)-methylase SpoU
MDPPSTHPIADPDDPRIAVYRDLKDADARSRLGVFVAEGRFVVRTLLSGSRFRVRSVLVTPAAREGIADALAGTDAPVLEVAQEVMNRVVGFDLHRGALAIGERGEALGAGAVVSRPGPVVVLEGVNNHDNVGGIFRNAAAFGAAGVLLGPGCVDPLYRKAIRVSMGAALRVPFAGVGDWPAGLDAVRASGRIVAALTPARDAVDLDRWAPDHAERARVAWLLGAEGPGLTRRAQEAADVRVRIPVGDLVDSLNVASASAIALHWSGAARRG